MRRATASRKKRKKRAKTTKSLARNWFGRVFVRCFDGRGRPPYVYGTELWDRFSILS